MSEQVIYVLSYHTLEEPVYQAGRMDVWERPAKYYKIGIAKDVDSRLSVLGTGTPHRLKKYTTIKSDKPKKVENILHRMFGWWQRPRGEWFKLHRNELYSLKALERIDCQNIKQVRKNYRKLSKESSLYVALHKARQDQLPELLELVQ